MDTMEAIYLILALLAVFAVIGGLMVCPFVQVSVPSNTMQIGTAWVMGAQFEKMFNATAPALATESMTHGEL